MLYEETVGFIILYFVNQVDLDFKLRRFHDFVSSIIRKKKLVTLKCVVPSKLPLLPCATV
jgi:hypothetical protein